MRASNSSKNGARAEHATDSLTTMRGGNGTESVPGHLGFEMVAFLLRFLLAGAPEPAPGHLGPQMVAFLLRLLLAGAPEPAPGHPGPQMVAFD